MAERHHIYMVAVCSAESMGDSLNVVAPYAYDLWSEAAKTMTSTN